MKHVFLFLLLGACVNTLATVRTVSNNPLNLAQYNSVQDAVNASLSGDTIYIHGSPITYYPGVTITDKRLTLLGPGWAPDKGVNSYTAIIYDITLSGTGTSNTELQGLVIQVGVTVGGFPHANNIRFFRNHFKSGVTLSSAAPFSGFVFEGNWFESSAINAGTQTEYYNFVFRNNIFYSGNSNGNITGFYNIANQNILFDHNLFYGNQTAGIIFYNCRGLRLSNNIFVRRNAAANNTGSYFNNNITYNAGVNDPWAAANGNNDEGGNVANQSPQMVHQDSVNAGINNPLLNFTIPAGPANNSGSDGKDMGLFYDATGAMNWTNSRLSRLPYIYNMSITNPIVPAGGILNVQVEARKSN